MDSSDLYYIKQQFILGAWKSLIELSPNPASPDYAETRLYQARAYIALSQPLEALKVLDAADTSLSVRAVRALANYVAKNDAEKALDELRDLSVEIEEEGVDPKENGFVRVMAGTAFAREGEVEEALETLGAGSDVENLEAVALIVQMYLSIYRVDLAKRECDRARKWTEDDLLLQQIEASIGLLTGKDSYSNPHTFYIEQLHNPSLSSGHLLLSRGTTHLLRGELPEAMSDFTEAQNSKNGVNGDALAATVVVSELAKSKANAATAWSQLETEYPNHPFVEAISKKEAEYDLLVSNFTVPPLAVSIAV